LARSAGARVLALLRKGYESAFAGTAWTVGTGTVAAQATPAQAAISIWVKTPV
jgi:hypothetical protein